MSPVKKLLPALLALALLTGCGGTADAAGEADAPAEVPADDTEALSLPETSPAGSISAPAAVTKGREPTEAFDLPAEVVEINEWISRSARQDDMPVGKLIELPEQGVALYGVQAYPTGGQVAWLQWGDTLAEFDWSFGGPLIVMPSLWCFDADDDGQEEVVAVTCGGTGTGVFISELHIVEKNGDGTLTDYRLPEELPGEQLAALLSTAVLGDRTYVVLGEELTEITRRLPETLAPEDIHGLVTGDWVSFSADAQPDALPVIGLSADAWLDAEDCPPTAWYVADISAAVGYADGTYTLSGFHLNSMDN